MSIRKLASIKPITDIKPIEGADAIECAIVDGGWPVVVGKGEYQVGDAALYFEIDSWIPHELAPFLSKGQEPREYNGVKGERLRTVRLRGQISQGLLLRLEDAFVDYDKDAPIEYGVDFSEQLNIQKWEAPIPVQLQGTMKGNFPDFIPKTDQERCQNLRKEIFETHKEESYEVTLKLDGSSMTVYIEDGEIGVCSRNIDLIETEENTFWKVAREYGIIDAMKKFYDETGHNFAIQGEMIGEGIQGNPEKIKGHKFYLFDVYDIDGSQYLKPKQRYEFLVDFLGAGANIEHIPVIDPGTKIDKIGTTIDDLLEMAEGPSLNPFTKREGIVFKSHDSNFTFKAISNIYLIASKS